MTITPLKLERVRQERTQIDLWTQSGVPQWRISLLERGVKPRLPEMEALAKALGVSLTYIFPVERYPDAINFFKSQK